MAKERLAPETVFVSYAREDLAFAERLTQDLHARGISIWIDQKIKPGSAWDQEIAEAIRRADTMLVILSPDSVASRTVGDEVSFALEDEDLVIPLLYRPCDVPLRLARLQRVDFTGDYERGFAQLVQRLRAQDDGTVRPNAVSAAPAPTALPAQPRRFAVLPVALAAAGAVGALGLVFAPRVVTSEQKPKQEQRPRAHQAASPPSEKPGLDQSTPRLGSQLLEQYRTLVDSRSRWLLNKQPWLSAAEEFESAALDSKLSTSTLRQLRSQAEFCRGRFALLEGRLEEAEPRFRAAIGADATWALPYLELTTILTRFGRYSDAYSQARLAHQVEPGLWLSAIAAGPVYAAEGRLSDAIAVYEAAQAKHDFPQVTGSLALAYHAGGQHDARATELALKALERDPDLVPALTVLGEQLLEAGTPLKALVYSQRMVDTALFDVGAWLLQGDVLLDLGRKPLARQAYQRAIDLFASTRQTGAPPRRLREVQAAVTAGRLPVSRRALDRSIPKATPTDRDRSRPPALPSPQGCGCAPSDLLCSMRCAGGSRTDF